MEKLNLKSTEVEKYRIIYNEKIIENSKQKDLEVCHGTLILNLRKAINGDPVGIIEDIWTEPSFRKRGLASQLIKELIEIAKDKKCYKIILDCSDENVKLYSKLGFKKWQNSMRLDI